MTLQQVYVYNKLCGTVKYVKGQNVYVVDCGGVVGRLVKITLQDRPLTLCEVEVLG